MDDYLYIILFNLKKYYLTDKSIGLNLIISNILFIIV